MLDTIQDIQLYVSIQSDIDYDTIKPHIDFVKRNFYANLFSSALNDAIELGDGIYEPLNKCYSTIIANHALSVAVPTFSVILGPNGALRTEGSEQKTAYKYQVNALVDSYVDVYLTEMNRLYDLLDSSEETDIQNAWADSPGYLSNKTVFVKSWRELSSFMTINRPALVYRNLMPQFEAVESLYLIPVLGVTFTQYLKNRINLGTLTTFEKQAVKSIANAQALFAIVEAMETNRLQYGPNGAFVREYISDSAYSNMTKATDSAEYNMRKTLKDRAVRVMDSLLKNIIFPNPSEFEVYFDDVTTKKPADVKAKKSDYGGFFKA